MSQSFTHLSLALVVAVALLSLCACPCTAAAERTPAAAAVWVVHPTVKVALNATPPAGAGVGGTGVIDLAAQRGESESAQIVVLPAEAAPLAATVTLDAALQATASVAQQGYVFCKPSTHYHPSGGGWLPDPLLPLAEGASVSAAAGETTTLVLTVAVAKEAMAGSYSGNATLTIGGSTVVVPIQITVWDIALADLRDDGALGTAFTFARSWTRFYPSGNATALQQQATQLMCNDNRIAPDDLYLSAPQSMDVYESLASSTNCAGGAKWMNLIDVTSMPGGGRRTNYSAQYVETLLNTLAPTVEALMEKGLLQWAYVYGFDETPQVNMPGVYQLFGAVKQKWPELRTMATLNWDTMPSDLPVDVWVQQYQEMNASTVASWRAANKTYWFYWCIGPSGSQFMNTFVERPAIQARLLFWYGSLNEVPGFLYYETDRWAGIPTDKAVMRRINGTSKTDFSPITWEDANGDGSFTYPGEDGLIGTIRLLNLRDGIEDWSLFYRLTPEQREPLIKQLVWAADGRSENPALLESVRRQAAALVAAAPMRSE